MNDTKIRNTKYKEIILKESEYVNVIEAGNIAKVQYKARHNSQVNTYKIDKDRYYLAKDLDYNESRAIYDYICEKRVGNNTIKMPMFPAKIKYYNHHNFRTDNVINLRQTFNRLSMLINANFRGNPNELWITLTYRPNERTKDYKQASKDFNIFMTKLRKKYSNLVYIAVPEPHADKYWHFHLLLKNQSVRKWYIANSELQHIWSKGFVKVERLNRSDNVGKYLTSYVTDMPISEYQRDNKLASVTDKDIKKVKTRNGKDKAIVKNARLMYYPAGIRYYRCSQNVQRPVKKVVKVKDIRNKYNQDTLTSCYETEISVNEFNAETKEAEIKLINKLKTEWHNLNKDKRLHKRNRY